MYLDLSTLRSRFRHLLHATGFQIKFRFESRLIWEECYSNLETQRIAASNSALDYFIEYEQGNGRQCEDFSSVLFSNQKPVAIWPLSITTSGNTIMLGRPGGLASSPHFLTLAPAKLKHKLARVCYRACIEFSKSLDIKEFSSACFEPGISAVSAWQIYAMQLGASCSVKHEALVDLRPPLEEIRRCFRKSYKSLVNRSEKLWSSFIVSREELPTAWREFKDLHLSVSKRQTRSDLSWELQKQAALNGEGFLIAVYSNNINDKRLIGAAFFMLSKYEAVYAVAAYDRNLYDQPVSHIVQLRAIEELKKRGCEWYHIGRCHYPGDSPAPSEKLMSISLFKSGFANHFNCSFELTQNLVYGSSHSKMP